MQKPLHNVAILQRNSHPEGLEEMITENVSPSHSFTPGIATLTLNNKSYTKRETNCGRYGLDYLL